MSDYIKAKVIRLPFPTSVLDKCKTDDCWDCEDYLKELLGDLWSEYGSNINRFELECTDKSFYIDYVLSYSYGEEVGDYGFSFYLNDEDIKKYRPLFEKITPDFLDSDLRKVSYCYYNACECPDYYKVSEDIFDEL